MLYPNYRPPSSDGLAVPKSSNVYNADPAQPFRYKNVSKFDPAFKQCRGHADYSSCNCSDADRFSNTIATSDCQQRVLRTYCWPAAIEIGP